MSYTIPLTLLQIRASQIAAQTEDQYSNYICNSYGEQVIAGYDWVTGANKVDVQNPDSENYVYEVIADVDTATTNTTYDYFIDMSGYQFLTIQWAVTSPGADTNTIKIYGTLLDDGTAPGSIAAADWEDITQYGFNISTAASTSASYVDTDAIVSLIPGFGYKFIHVENVISNGGSNDSTHKIMIKKWY